jgi:hypothetical protein
MSPNALVKTSFFNNELTCRDPSAKHRCAGHGSSGGKHRSSSLRGWLVAIGMLGPVLFADAAPMPATALPRMRATGMDEIMSRASSLVRSIAPEARDLSLVASVSEVSVNGGELRKTVSIECLDILGRLVARSVWDEDTGLLVSVEHFQAGKSRASGSGIAAARSGAEAWRWLRATGIVGQDSRWRLAGVIPIEQDKLAAVLIGDREITVLKFDRRNGAFHSACVHPRGRAGYRRIV